MKRIKLFNGSFALIDDADYGRVVSTKWRLSTNGYVICTTHDYVDGLRKTYHPSLHRLIIGAKKGEVIDHINRNKLDNRRKNLRLVTQGANIVNSPVKTNNTSGHTGVRRSGDYWLAEIGWSGRQLYLGKFKDKLLAIKARKNAEREYYPI